MHEGHRPYFRHRGRAKVLLLVTAALAALLAAVVGLGDGACVGPCGFLVVVLLVGVTLAAIAFLFVAAFVFSG